MNATHVLWAKKTNDHPKEQWLPLPVHLGDSAETVRLLWNHWVPDCIKEIIASGVIASGECVSIDTASLVAVFLAGVHDVGKATPIFQDRSRHTDIDEIIRSGLI